MQAEGRGVRNRRGSKVLAKQRARNFEALRGSARGRELFWSDARCGKTMVLNAIPLGLELLLFVYLGSRRSTSCTLRKIGLQLLFTASEGGGTSICMLGKL